MGNVIAVIWDCDKTLIDGYMQDPIFEEYNIDPKKFWNDVNAEVESYARQGIRVNRDTYYLNYFIRAAHEGMFPGLNNQKLREFGKKQKFYKGVPEIFNRTKDMINKNPRYAELGIKVEHYIVSTGFAELIRGSILNDYVEDIWGCELTDAPDENGDILINEVVYTIDNTTKTRAIFEINKGKDIDVNAKIPKEMRRAQFKNMIYIADGPSDIPAFSLVDQMDGATFAIYPRGDEEAMKQVEEMRDTNRVNMYAEADYQEGTTADLWIRNKITKIADRIVKEHIDMIKNSTSGTPKHLSSEG